ncbi:MAG: molybdopterin-dependent oxidoreductase [Thermoanaerobaculales bacterium]|nr:molybdopterin-dependent oxidoreductase [Thermoanaerobaculales bacterium]
MTNSIAEIEQAKIMLVIGSNTTEAHPVISYFMKRAQKNGATLIVCDPRTIDLCRWADLHVQHRVGSDVALINGLIHEIIKQGLEDREFIEQHTENFEAIREAAERYPVDRVSGITGISAELIQRVARILGEADSAAVFYTLGITEHICGTDNVKSLANLQMLLGNIGKPSTGLNPLRGQNNVQGACDSGALPDVFHNYQKVNDPAVIEKFETAWNRPGLSDKVGLTLPSMLSGLKDGNLRALFIFGENIIRSEPNSAHTAACLEAAEFVVATEIFETETTEYADVVFPATCWAEVDGTYTNTERRVQRVRPILRPPGEARDDWWVFAELAKRMGYDLGVSSSAELWEEFRELGTSYHGITWERCEEVGVQWPAPTLDHPGTPYLHKDGQFTRGKGRFEPADWVPPAELPDEQYPLILSTGRRLWHYQTGTQTRRSVGFNEVFGEELIELSPADADHLGIIDGERVRVTSRRGTIDVKAWVTDRSPEGVCWMGFHFGEANANELTIDAFDPVTDTAELKHCAIRVEKVG